MPRSSSTRWYAAIAALVVFVLLAWLLGEVLTLTNGERTTLRVGLIVLGLLTAVALLWYLRPGQDGVAVPKGGDDRDDALVAVDAARRRLPRGAFDAKPIALVVGTEGSCKTSIVTHAGLDAELLAGDAVPGAGAAAPTAAANLWLARDAVVAEPGGGVFADPARWQRFVRALRAPRLGAALGRSAPPPRVAVLCVSCDLFYGGNGGEQLDTLAQLARDRLATAARQLGHAFPVHVVFTKADRIPHFEAWVAPFTREEIREPLGAAVSLDGTTGAAGAGSYAERLTPRIESAFATLATSLASRRLELLGRESVAERRLAAYEVPRELGKLAPAATKFLVEVCRPTQIGASPQLRGFYFVGARPVVVSDVVAPAAAMPAAAAASALTPGATSAFLRPNAGMAPPAAAGAYAPPTSRRVPQWTFLERLFPDVIFADPAAPVLAGGGSRVAGLRRAMLGVGIAAMLLIAAGVLRSWLGNRALAERTTTAARAVAALPIVAAPAGTIAFPSPDALRTLDGLRGVLDTLRAYQADRPFRLGWGLWRGDALIADARRVWFDGYKRQLHDVAWGALVDSLKTLPDVPRPSDDYGHDYAALKAYLITTAEPPRSTSTFLAPVLLDAWRRGQTVDADVSALARRQFEFYSTELARANPWPTAAEAPLVTHTRNFLGAFTGGERIYQNMRVEGDKTAPPARLADLSPVAAGIVTGIPEVAGSLTAAGWRFMQDAFRNSDRFFQGEKWVLGDVGAALTQNRDSVITTLRGRYREDYVTAWRAYVHSLGVMRPASAADAATKLAVIGGPQSPVLAALALAARNTNIDSAMAAAFQPVHAVTAPTVLDKFVAENNQPYVIGLTGLQSAMQALALPGAGDSASVLARVAAANQTLMMQASQARSAARQIEINFHVDAQAGQLSPAVGKFLEAPIDGAEGLLRQIASARPPAPRHVAAGGGGGGGAPAPTPAPTPAAPPGTVSPRAKTLNERGTVLCAAITPMLAKFPFNSDASTEATVAEVAGALAPGTGKLWAFQQEQLGDVLEKQGDKWVQKADAPVALSAGFLAFFNRAARVSDALFAGGEQPRVIFHARGVPTEKAPQITLKQGTQEAKFLSNTPPNQFVWPSATGRDVTLSAEGNGRFLRGAKNRTLDRATGDWAIYRLVAHAAKLEGAGANLKAEWNGGDLGPVAVEFTFNNGFPVLQRGWLGGMSCAEQVTK